MIVNIQRSQCDQSVLFSKYIEFSFCIAIRMNDSDYDKVKKYKLNDYVVADIEIKDRHEIVKFSSFKDGYRFKSNDLKLVVEVESKVKKGIELFDNLLNNCVYYGIGNEKESYVVNEIIDDNEIPVQIP